MDFTCGHESWVDGAATVGAGTRIGRFCIIERDCRIGAGCRIGDYVKLMPGTVIGQGCQLDDYVNSSGAVVLGDEVLVKRMTCLTQGTIVEDKAFIGPGAMIIHEKHVSFQRDVEKISHGVYICTGAVIGGGALLNAGVHVGPNAHVGVGAVVTKDCAPDGVYVGIPARRAGTVPESARIEVADRAILRFAPHVLREYLPDLRACGPYTV